MALAIRIIRVALCAKESCVRGNKMHAGTHGPAARIGPQESELFLDLVRSDEIIGIQPGEVFTPGFREEVVASGDDPFVISLGEDPDAGIRCRVPLQDGQRMVVTRVVTAENLYILVSLVSGALERSVQKGLRVVNRN